MQNVAQNIDPRPQGTVGAITAEIRKHAETIFMAGDRLHDRVIGSGTAADAEVSRLRERFAWLIRECALLDEDDATHRAEYADEIEADAAALYASTLAIKRLVGRSAGRTALAAAADRAHSAIVELVERLAPSACEEASSPSERSGLSHAAE